MEENVSIPTRDVDLSRVLSDMARAVVDHPDKVKVRQSESDDGILLTLAVDEEDMGMVIGKHGKIARALRTVMKAAAKIADKKVTVDIE
jgi:predicted RNA-binding protein YlqC (UPF0109 family)